MLLPRYLLILLCLALTSVIACSDVFDDDTDDIEVESVTIDNVVVRVGAIEGIDVDFQFDEDEVFNDNEDVTVAVVLPAGLAYVDGSAEIDGFFDDEDVDPVVVNCEDGSTILFFDFDDDDLNDLDDPSGAADARVEFDVVGIAPNEAGIIDARADYNSVSAVCGVPLAAQKSILISVIE